MEFDYISSLLKENTIVVITRLKLDTKWQQSKLIIHTDATEEILKQIAWRQKFYLSRRKHYPLIIIADKDFDVLEDSVLYKNNKEYNVNFMFHRKK